MKTERKIRVMTAAAGCLLAALLAYELFYSPKVPGIRSVSVPAYTSSQASSGRVQTNGGKININTADEEELTRLHGIGPELASRIIEYRIRNGGFSRVEELMEVSGIGEATFEKLRDDVQV